MATARNEIVAEVTSQPARRAHLVLPPARYRVIRRDERRAYAADVDLRSADATVSDDRFSEVNPELALAKGQDVSRRNELYVDLALSGLGPGVLNTNGEIGVGWFRRGVRWSFGPHLAYGRTVAATLPSLWGPQHPSFAYELTGTGQLVLTNLRRKGRALWLPAG